MAIQTNLRKELTPLSQPTDRFVRTSAGGELEQVARALGSISPEVAQLSETLFDKGEKEDTEKGERAANEAFAKNVKSEADALRKGLIQPNQSKAFQRAFAKTLGQHRALEAGRELAQFAENNLGEETDDNVMREKLATFRAEMLKGVEPESADMKAAFTAQYLAVESNTLLNLSYRIGQNQKKALERAKGAIISNGIDIETARVANPGEALAPLMERLKGVYTSQRQSLYDSGITGERANRVVMDAVAQKAVAEGRPELIDALMVTPNGPGGSATFGTTPELAAELRNSYNTARSVRYMQQQDERLANEREAEKILKEMQDQIIQWRRDGRNPQLFDTTEFESRLSGLGREFAGWAREEASAMSRASNNQRSAVSDEEMIPLIYDRGLSFDGLRGMREQGKFTVEDYVRYRDMIERRQSNAYMWEKRETAKAGGASRGSENTLIRWEEQAVFRAVDSLYFAAPDLRLKFRSDYGLRFRYDFDEWRENNPEATRQEVKDALADIRDKLISEINPKAQPTNTTTPPAKPAGGRSGDLR